MQHWEVVVTYECEVDDDQAEQLAGRGGFIVVTVDRQRGRTTVTFGVDARSISAATTAAVRRARELAEGITTGEPVALRVLTDRELAAELEQPTLPRLADSARAQQILGGISQQRLSKLMQTREDFPRPVDTFAGGRHVWIAAHIEAFNERWDRTPGRPVKVER